MATNSSEAARGALAPILDLITHDGSASVLYTRTLSDPRSQMRDLADAVHALCVLHGAFPGLVDHALAGAQDEASQQWLTAAAAAIADERVLLARLTASVGPMPSTPNHASAEAAILSQRHAMEMLARSDRAGCAWGTAIAFVLDWEAIRVVLDSCATRLGIAPRSRFAPVAAATRGMVDDLAVPPSVARAMVFGAQQTLAQHRGLWQLLEARSIARQAL